MIRRLPRAAFLALLALAVVVPGCSRTTKPTPLEWELAWQDEFDGPAGQVPDPTDWSYDVGTGWGNAQLEYDTARPENASLDGDGHLVITARKEPWLGSDYTSARINTRGHFAQARGRFEARIRLPRGQGIWPAFWLLGDNFGSVGWPACGEVDIMEYRGQEPSVNHGSLHGPGYSGGSALTHRYTLPGTAGFDADYHLFAIEWDADSITWIVDDTPYYVVHKSDLPSGADWVFDHPFFVILNVAVGGTFVGPPNAGTVFPQTMLVDWVRVYRSRS